MRNLSICLTAFLAVSSLAAKADNAESLVFYGTGGNKDSVVELAKIGKLTFGNDGFSVVQTDGTATSLGYANVMSIKFKNLTTGIEALKQNTAEGIALHFDGQSLWAEGDGAVGATAAVYSVNGQRMAGAKYDGSHISVENLPKGVYMFKVGGKSIKFAK